MRYVKPVEKETAVFDFEDMKNKDLNEQNQKLMNHHLTMQVKKSNKDYLNEYSAYSDELREQFILTKSLFTEALAYADHFR